MRHLSAILLTSLCLLAQPVQGADAFALVIGNSDYDGAFLKNPVNDADAVSTALRKLNFDVTTLKNLDITGFDTALLNFKQKLTKGSVAIFYFAGHGLQIEGVNYLIPLKHGIQAKEQVRRKCIEVDQVLNTLDSSPSNLNVLILDACRNNPFERSWTRSIAGRGLASIEAPRGTVIAFSTAKGKVALDGKGQNSPYTESLVSVLGSLPQEGMEIYQIFKKASQHVYKTTQQEPYLYEASFREDFLLKPPTAAVTATEPGGLSAADMAFGNQTFILAPGKEPPPNPSVSRIRILIRNRSTKYPLHVRADSTLGISRRWELAAGRSDAEVFNMDLAAPIQVDEGFFMTSDKLEIYCGEKAGWVKVKIDVTSDLDFAIDATPVSQAWKLERTDFNGAEWQRAKDRSKQ